MRFRSMPVMVLLALLCAVSHAVAETAGPPALASTCDSCHGASAPSPHPDVPTIHGQHAEAIENALFDFRAGTRSCRVSTCIEAGTCPDTDMCAITADLSPEDIAEMSAWYAGKPFVPAGQPHDAELAAHGREIHAARCETCHTQGGIVGIEQASRLRGQHKAYLRTALDDYMAGRRTATGVMAVNVKELTEDEIAALVEFYASPAD